jgi:hypothetical protein
VPLFEVGIVRFVFNQGMKCSNIDIYEVLCEMSA